MNMTDLAKDEERTLRQYLDDKLGMSITAFAESQEINLRTLYARWEGPDGKVHVMNAVHSFYVMRFMDL